VQWGDAAFPAWVRPDGTLVDLRNYEKAFPAEWQAHLRAIGVPDPVMESARGSQPVGFALLGDA